MDEQRLAEIEARVTAASQAAPTPWSPFGQQVISSEQRIIAQTDDCVVSNLMSHAPEDLTALTTEVRLLRAVIQKHYWSTIAGGREHAKLLHMALSRAEDDFKRIVELEAKGE